MIISAHERIKQRKRNQRRKLLQKAGCWLMLVLAIAGIAYAWVYDAFFSAPEMWLWLMMCLGFGLAYVAVVLLRLIGGTE